MHVFVGIAGALLIKKGVSFRMAALITAPLHGLLEALVIIPFVGIDIYNLVVLTGIGTILHHSVDAFISYVMLDILSRTKHHDFA